jgi:hypothetical protein
MQSRHMNGLPFGRRASMIGLAITAAFVAARGIASAIRASPSLRSPSSTIGEGWGSAAA